VVQTLIQSYRKKHDVSSNQKPPYFVDLAANDAIQLSNTLYLEKKEWVGLCVEPNSVYWYRLISARKCAIAAAFVGGQRDMQEVDVSLTNEEYGGIVGAKMDNTPEQFNPHDRGLKKDHPTEKRFTVSLRTVFKQFLVPNEIDYLSLDVEGAEELIMQDFPFDEYTFRIMTVERPKPELQRLLERNGYRMVMKLIFWGETLWIHKSFDIPLEEVKELVHSVTDFPKKKPGRKSLVWFKNGDYRQIQPRTYDPED